MSLAFLSTCAPGDTHIYTLILKSILKKMTYGDGFTAYMLADDSSLSDIVFLMAS